MKYAPQWTQISTPNPETRSSEQFDRLRAERAISEEVTV